MAGPPDISADVIILGGGAAGLMTARLLGLQRKQVVVIERSARLGAKILLAGGGKCNFTNRDCSADNYISQNPHFCKSALARFGPADFINLLDEHRVAYEQRQEGRLFCRHSAVDLLNMLVDDCRRHDVRLLLNCPVTAVDKVTDHFTVITHSAVVKAPSLVVATGGLSYPQAGATDLGYRIARQFNLAVTPCRPGLVPLMFDKTDQDQLGDLTGISARATVTCNSMRFNDDILFTHQGLSGPAILQVSNYWREGNLITIDWLPSFDVLEILTRQKERKGGTAAQAVLSDYLPNRMAAKWSQLYFPQTPLAQCTSQQIKQAADRINRWPFQPTAAEGYAKAEVTIGGVSTDELSSKTMETHQVKGLFFVGEVVDVTGRLGGYNLQWAWSSAAAAASV